MQLALTAREVRRLRAPKPAVDPWRPHGWQLEEERLADGALASDLTVFLAGRECPWACVFCDLWRFTTDAPTPAGAIPGQLRQALSEAGRLPATAQLKLYNASNHFDDKAVPAADDAAIARLARPFARVIVESHPKLVGDRALRFADRLEGRLEVAMGLETVHPGAQPRLGKGAGLGDYARAAALLVDRGLSWRAFVLVGAPFVAAGDDTRWVVETVRWAAAHGAAHVALIPVRGGNGLLETLARTGDWTPPTLDRFEDAVDACLEPAAGSVLTADLWDLEGLAGGCPACRARRRERLAAINRDGCRRPRARCPLKAAGQAT